MDTTSILKQTNISLLKTKINLAMPVIGPVINEFLFVFSCRIKQDRINKLVEELERKMATIEMEQINQDYLKSESFFDLTRNVFQAAIESNVDVKRKFLANVYLDSIIKSDTDLDLKETFIAFIKSMTTNQITILKFINDHESKLVEIRYYAAFYDLFNKSFPGLISDKYEFKYYSQDLEIKSLISMGGGLNNFDDQGARLLLESHKDASIVVTSVGKKFIDYLTE